MISLKTFLLLFVTTLIICFTIITRMIDNNELISNHQSFYTTRRLLATNRVGNQVHRKNLDVSKKFDIAKEKGNELLNLIYNRYEMYDEPGSQFFLTANNYGKFHWNILKYKYAQKLLMENSTFLMIFGGSSVTAGHDNYYNQSYPMIVKKRLEPLMKAAGIELIVHNIAQGANNCIPYTFCYESMGGLDPDFIGWEQSYNCGRDESIFELVGRISAFSANRGLVYYSASGAWLPDSCPSSTDKPPFCFESWTPDQASLFRNDANNKSPLPKITTDREFLSTQRDRLNEYHQARPTASRFISYANINGNDDYHRVVPHGFNVWEPNPKCKTVKEDGNHDNCNGIDAVQGCKMRFMSHEAAIYGSDSGGGARWHPSRAFHLLRGEAIAWLYALPLLDAIYMIEEDIVGAKSTKDMIDAYEKELNNLQPSSLPKPKKCGQYLCDKRPLCYTNFKPHYTAMTLSSLIVGRHNWTLDDDNYPEWSLHYGFLDLKPMFVSDGPQHGPLHIRIHIGETDQVLLCGQVKESMKFTHIYLDQNIYFDTNNITEYAPKNPQLWTEKKYIGNECKYITHLPRGDHVLSIEPHKEQEKHRTGLSHVVMWP